MNIVNAYARISELSNRKLEVQNKLRKELEQIDQMGAKLEEHTSKIREYDPYKADLILDKFNLWKEYKVGTLQVKSDTIIFKLEKQMKILQAGVVYTNDINGLKEAYEIETHNLDLQQKVELKSSFERKRLRNLDENEQRYYFLTQQYENLKNELTNAKIQLKSKYKAQLKQTKGSGQRHHLSNKYRADKKSLIKDYQERVDLLSIELKQAKLIVKTNLPSQRKLVLRQDYLTKVSAARNEYLKSTQVFRNQNNRAQNTYRSTIAKLKTNFKRDPHDQRIAATQRAYQHQIKRQKGANLSAYHNLLAEIHAITKNYLSDKRDLNHVYNEHKREWNKKNAERNNKLSVCKKQYALVVKSIQKEYAKHKKEAIENKSNANVLKHLKTQYVSQLSNAKQHYLHNVNSVKPILMKDFKPSYRSLFRTYQLAIRSVRAKISANKKTGNEKIRKILANQKRAIVRINKERDDRFHRTPASPKHRDRNITKAQLNYAHLLQLSKKHFHTSIDNCRHTIRETELNQITSRKDYKSNLAYLKNKYQKQIYDLNLEIKKSKLPTEQDLQKIDNLKTKYASEVKRIHTQYFEQHQLSNKNIKTIRNKTRQELKHVATDKKHASAASFTFENKYIRASRKQKTLAAAKVLRQSIKKMQNNDKLSKHALKVLTQKHIDFNSSQHVTHVKELDTHFNSKRIYGKYIGAIRIIRKATAKKLAILRSKNVSKIATISKLIKSVHTKIDVKRTELTHKVHLVVGNKNNQIQTLIKSKKALRVEHNKKIKTGFATFTSAKNDVIKSNNYQEAKRLRAHWKLTKRSLVKELAQKLSQVKANTVQVKRDANNRIVQLHKDFDIWLNNQNNLIKSYDQKINVEYENNELLIRDLKIKSNGEIREEVKKYRLARQEFAKVKREFDQKTSAMKKQHHAKMLAEAKSYTLARKTLISNATNEHNSTAKQAHDKYHDSILAINRDCEIKLTQLRKERNVRIKLYEDRASLLRTKSAKAISNIKLSLANFHNSTVVNLKKLERNYHSLLKNLNTQVEKDRQARNISIHTQMQRYKALKEKYHESLNLLTTKFEKRETLNKQIFNDEQNKMKAYANMYSEKVQLLKNNYLSELNTINTNHYSASVSSRVQYLQKIALAREQLKLTLKANVDKYLIAKEKYNLFAASQKETLEKAVFQIRSELPRLERRQIISHRNALAKLQSKYIKEIETLKNTCEKNKQAILRFKTTDKTKYYDELHRITNQYAIHYEQLCNKYYEERANLKNKHKFWMSPHKLIRIEFNYRHEVLLRRYTDLISKIKTKYINNMKIANENHEFFTPGQLYDIRVFELKTIYRAAKSRAKKQLDAVVAYYNNQYETERLAYKAKHHELASQGKITELKALKFAYKSNKFIKYRAAAVAINRAYEQYKDNLIQAKSDYKNAIRGYKQSKILRLRNEHAMPMFERLYANIVRGQKHLAEAELARLQIMKEDKKLRKVFTNLPLWVSTYIKFAFVVSALWVFMFVICQLLYFLVGGDAFNMFSWTDGGSHLSIFGMTSVIALVLAVTLTCSALVLYILECKSKRHVETKLRLENIQTLEKTNQQLNKEYKKLYQFSRDAQIQNSELAEKLYVDTRKSFQSKLDQELDTLRTNNHTLNKQLNNQFIHHNKYILQVKDAQIAQQDALYTKSLDKHIRNFNSNIQAQADEANDVLLAKQHEFRHKLGQLVSLQQQEIHFKKAEIQALEVAKQRETNKYKLAIRDLVNLQNQELHLKQIEYSKNLATNKKRIEEVLRTNKTIYLRNRRLVNEISELRKEVVKAKAHANSLAVRVAASEEINKLRGPDKKKAKFAARQQKSAYRRMLKQKRINERMAKKQARKAQKNKKN